MQITLRSHLIAGTAAVVGAGAIAMTPVTAAHLNLPAVQAQSVAQVALAGFDSPLTELLSTVFLAGNYLFDTGQNPLVPGSWPFSGIAAGTGPVGSLAWPAALGSDELGGYSSVGLVPQIIDDALPIISTLGYNGSTYLQAAISGLSTSGIILSEGVWNAVGDLITLDIPGALNTLVTAVQQAGGLALSTAGFVVANVVTKASAVAQFLISEIPTLVGSTVGQIKVLVNALIAPIKNVIAAFGQPKPVEGAWNAVVDGLLGPSGIPGTVLNLSIGAGVQTGPINANTPQQLEPAIKANFVPSIRTEVQAAVKGVQAALETVPSSAAAVRPGAAHKAVRAAAAEAPSVADVVASDAPEAPKASTGSDNKSAGKHRAARGAAARSAAS